MTIILLSFFSSVLSCYLQVHLTCMRKIQVTVVVEQRKKGGAKDRDYRPHTQSSRGISQTQGQEPPSHNGTHSFFN